MDDTDSNATLNDVLIDLDRSLLQYVGESWPWTSAHETEARETIEKQTAAQRGRVARIVELLQDREQPIDFGSYPDYSDLHYVSLDYMIGRLVTHEAAVVERVAAAAAATDEPLLDEILAGERDTLDKLRALAEQQKQAGAAG